MSGGLFDEMIVNTVLLQSIRPTWQMIILVIILIILHFSLVFLLCGCVDEYNELLIGKGYLFILNSSLEKSNSNRVYDYDYDYILSFSVLFRYRLWKVNMRYKSFACTSTVSACRIGSLTAHALNCVSQGMRY